MILLAEGADQDGHDIQDGGYNAGQAGLQPLRWAPIIALPLGASIRFGHLNCCPAEPT